MEKYSQTMSGTDMVISAMTLFGQGLDFLIKVDEKAILQENELAEVGTKLDSFRSTLDLEKRQISQYEGQHKGGQKKEGRDRGHPSKGNG